MGRDGLNEIFLAQQDSPTTGVTKAVVCAILFVGWKEEGNVLFNDALNTFYLRLYGVGHMVEDHSDCRQGTISD